MVTPAAKSEAAMAKRQKKRDNWEQEVVNTDVLVYYKIDKDGDPVIMELVSPTKTIYADLADTIAESSTSREGELCECSNFELDTDHDSWLEKFYPEWNKFVDPDFYCFICTDLDKCHPDWLEAGENVKEKIKENYPPGAGAGKQ